MKRIVKEQLDYEYKSFTAVRGRANNAHRKGRVSTCDLLTCDLADSPASRAFIEKEAPMEMLTEKQKKARAYYAKNAEAVKAGKRAAYRGKAKKKRGLDIVIESSKHKKSKQIDISKRTQPALSRVEDIINERKANELYSYL